MKNLFGNLGLIDFLLDIIPYQIRIVPKNKISFPKYIENEFKTIYEKCHHFTMTSWERLYTLYQASRYIYQNKIKGDIVECGVWKGGSMMAVALLLKKEKPKRKIYLYDTFEGMTKPDFIDKTLDNFPALEKWKKLRKKNFSQWCYSPLSEVKKNLFSTGYPQEKLIFIKGKVEKTIPKYLPSKIALLRLDTDWYQSTYHELKYLFSKLTVGGVLIIDDYFRWQGARKATDKYFKENKVKIFLQRIDNSGVCAIKLN